MPSTSWTDNFTTDYFASSRYTPFWNSAGLISNPINGFSVGYRMGDGNTFSVDGGLTYVSGTNLGWFDTTQPADFPNLSTGIDFSTPWLGAVTDSSTLAVNAIDGGVLTIGYLLWSPGSSSFVSPGYGVWVACEAFSDLSGVGGAGTSFMTITAMTNGISTNGGATLTSFDETPFSLALTLDYTGLANANFCSGVANAPLNLTFPQMDALSFQVTSTSNILVPFVMLSTNG